MSFPDASNTEYHKFAGQFVSEFATLEFTLRMIIRWVTNLDERTYEILVGHPRSGELRSMAKKLTDLQTLDDLRRRRVDEAFEHLNTVAKLRDWVVHYGALSTNDGRALAITRKSFASFESMFKMADLWPAILDLRKVSCILMEAFSGMPEGTISLEVLNGAWLYTPLPLIHRP